MTTSRERPTPGRRLFVRPARAGDLALVALLALSGVVLHRPLHEVPVDYDALYYASQSLALVQGRGSVIAAGDGVLPAFYPIGTPLLLSPAYALAGPEPRHGVHAVHAYGIAAVGATAALARAFAGPWAGLAAGLALLGSGAFRWTGGQVLSNVPAALAVVLVLAAYARCRSPRSAALVGAAASLTALVRFALATLPISLALAELWVGRTRGDRRLPVLLALGAGCLAGGCVVLLHNALVFGGPLETGYDLWLRDAQFGLRHLLAPTHGSPTPTPGEFRLVRALAGLGAVWSLPAVVAALAGLAWLATRTRERRDAGALAAAAATSVALQALLLGLSFYRDEIYLVPLAPVVAALAAVGLCGPSPRRWRPVAALLLAAVAWQALPSVRQENLERRAHRTRRIIEIAQRLEPDGLLVTGANPVLVGHYLSPRREALHPVRAGGPLTWLTEPFVRGTNLQGEVAARVADALAGGRPVYLDRSPPYSWIAPDRDAYARLVAGLVASFEARATPLPDLVRLQPAGARAEGAPTGTSIAAPTTTEKAELEILRALGSLD